VGASPRGPFRFAAASRTATAEVNKGDAVVSVAPVEIERTESESAAQTVPDPDTPWVTIVHNDPVNLMSYVVYVFQSYFGYPKEKARKLMMDVHQKGRAVVSSGSREEMERDVQAMHGYGLWATLSHDR
jgi:ATP-dependent Clp protease adaptor protein ClpS